MKSNSTDRSQQAVGAGAADNGGTFAWLVGLFGGLTGVLVGCGDRGEVDRSQVERQASPPPIAATPIPPASSELSPGRSVRAVSFNVRVSLKQDGDNSWRNRRELAIDTVRNLAADFVGLQEAFVDQRLAFKGELDEFVETDGSPDGSEFANLNPILVRDSRFEVVREGRFWLSVTPDKPLSVSWGSKIPRACTLLVARERATARELVVVNVHLPSGVALACLESARLIVERLRPFAGLPQIVLGDLNSRIETPPLHVLLAAGLVDCFGTLHADSDNVRTYHAFGGDPSGLHRIDFVLSSSSWTSLAAGIDRSERDGRYPSDHFPVWADLGW